MEDNNDYTEDDIELVENGQDEEPAASSTKQDHSAELNELNDKYLRLHADFDNYRKRVNRDREELQKYGNESLMYELLPAIDNLELALKHATGDINNGLVQGVELSLRELQRSLDKFGLRRIEAAGRPFDPSVHHAMSQVERADLDEKMVAEEFRAGYKYHDKVLRPSLVAVSTRPQRQETGDPHEVEIKITDNTKEEE